MTPYFVVWIPSQTNDSQFIAIEPKAQTCIKQQTKDNLSRTMLEKSFILVFLGEVCKLSQSIFVLEVSTSKTKKLVINFRRSCTCRIHKRF